MKTYSAKPTEVNRQWHIIDASELTLGRICVIVARLLTGKSKPMYTPHIDCGDYVIVTNSDQIKVTGQKLTDKITYRHSGYPGGIKSTSLQEQMEKDSTRVIIHAVKGMLPVNKLRDERLKRLKVYADGNHGHEAQKPHQYTVKESK